MSVCDGIISLLNGRQVLGPVIQARRTANKLHDFHTLGLGVSVCKRQGGVGMFHRSLPVPVLYSPVSRLIQQLTRHRALLLAGPRLGHKTKTTAS